ncbi:Fic family protein [candidate division KSB1 bacterium]|nr:Fic family protein [candidate division KSB1 bacterium]
MNITDKKYFQQYSEKIYNTIVGFVEKFDFSEKQIDLHYFTQASAVYSSNIEGNSIDLNSFMNFKLSPTKFKFTKEVEEIENLITAYQFAQNSHLNEENFLECHKIFSKTLLIKSKRGKYRNDRVGVFGESGLVYLAIEPEFVKDRMKQFFINIKILLKQNHSLEEVFYFASLIHLIFAHIHPFMDGNGRAARILEKWFLVEKLGSKFWKIPSEKYYKDNQEQYYQNINLGVNYYELNYDNCLSFLLMLPNSLKSK